MAIKQISVFVENKPGRLADITGFLAAKVLKEHGVAVSITEVVGISIPDVTGAFAKVVKLLSDAGENVEYAYAFLTPEEGHAYVIFRVDNNEKACEHLKENGVDVIEENSLL